MRPLVACIVMLLVQVDPQPIQRMAATDRAYEAAALELGKRDALLAFLAPDAVTLDTADPVQPGPAAPIVAALPLARLPLGLREIWEPYTGQVSGDGAFGWTTGARASLTSPIATLPSQGAYLRIWSRQADGAWRVWLEEEVRFPHLWQDAAPFRAAPDPDAGTVGSPGEPLTAADDSVADGGDTWSARLSASVRVHRGGLGTLADRATVLTWARTGWTGVFERLGIKVAASDDLGVTMGRYVLAATRERGAWVRVWKRDMTGRWRIVAETSRPAR